MAVEAQAQKLQADATGCRQLGRIALRCGMGIRRLAIGEMHSLRIQPQGGGEPAGHLRREGAGVGAIDPHVGIEVEAAPAPAQLLPLRWGQAVHLAGQGGIDRLHRAAGGQAERTLRPQLPVPQQQGGHPVGQAG